MHTTTYIDKTTRVNFHHHGDFSGEVLIQYTDLSEAKEKELELPFEALKFVVAEYIRSKEISRLEDESTNDLLGIME